MMRSQSIYGFLLMSALGFTFIACGDDQKFLDAPTTLSVTPDNTTMSVGQEKQLSASGATKWTSENEYVAKVDARGVVFANHIGTANIYASDDNAMGKCTITVEPHYLCYDTPLLNFGASMKSIIDAENHQKNRSDSKYLYYNYTNGTIQTLVQYVFDDNDALEGINVIATYSDYTKIAFYLLERYEYAAQADNSCLFINALTEEATTLLVLLSKYTNGNNNYTVVTYMPYNEH